jgi:hypothetical protein
MSDFNYCHLPFLTGIETLTPDEWSRIMSRIIEFRKTGDKDFLNSVVKIIEA